MAPPVADTLGLDDSSERQTMTLKLDKDGNVILFPLDEYQLATLPDGAIAIFLTLVPSPEALNTSERSLVQISLTRNRARELAEDLLKTAEMPYMPRPRGHA